MCCVFVLRTCQGKYCYVFELAICTQSSIVYCSIYAALRNEDIIEAPRLNNLRFYDMSASPVNATYHLGQSEIPLLDHCKDLGIIIFYRPFLVAAL